MDGSIVDQQDYEYYYEDEEFIEPVNHPVKTRIRNVKVQLTVGSTIDVFSKSKQKWINGQITKVEGNLILVTYMTDMIRHKWLKSTSKEFRPTLKDIVYTAYLTKLQYTHNKQNIGDSIELISNNKWIPAIISGIKDNLLRIAYGKGYSKEKWIKSNSKEFRQKSLDPNCNLIPPPPNTPNSGIITHSLRREKYQIHSVPSILGINKERGDLKIKIKSANKLITNCNIVYIKVANINLKTKKSFSNVDPSSVSWDEILIFSNFRPNFDKKGIISIGNKSVLKGEKVIASTEFELPIVFDRVEKLIINITDKDNKLSAIVELEQVIVGSSP